jgi:hypothetical protein
MMTDVFDAIAEAEKMLPGVSDTGEARHDPRWQAIISVGEYVETNPEEVWQFAARWGTEGDDDLRMAVATCLVEHLLEYHFDTIFPRVADLVRRDARFASTFRSCWSFGQSAQPERARRVEVLKQEADRLWG